MSHGFHWVGLPNEDIRKPICRQPWSIELFSVLRETLPPPDYPPRASVDKFRIWVGRRSATTFDVLPASKWPEIDNVYNTRLKTLHSNRFFLLLFLCLSLFFLLLTRLLVTTASAMSWSSCSSRLRSISSESRKESRCAVSSALTAFLSVIDCFSLRTSCMKVKIQLSVRLPDGSSPYRHTRGCYTLEYWNTSWQLLYVYTVRPPRTNLSIKPCGAWRFLSRGSCARR